MPRRLLILCLLACSVSANEPPASWRARLAVDAERAQRTVEYLADDAREGREAGSAGSEATIQLGARVFRELGLEPAGSEGYRQPFTVDGRAMANVVAALPGSGETDEAILIGAHLDHLGRGKSGSMSLLERGEIHNGADDNASGVAAVLELARALVASGVRPRRRVVFALFDGEEQGLLGSKHMAKTPCFSERLTLMINLDMVGRLEGPLTVAGAKSGGELLTGWLHEAGREIHLQLRAERAVYSNSDHYPFYKQKVPVLVPFTGLHRDYHRPSDDVELVNAEGIAQVARLAAGVVLRAAAAEQTPTYTPAPEATLAILLEQAQAFLRLPTRRTAPKLGVRVEEARGGLRVVSVDAGSPAAQAGLEASDVITRAGGVEVGSRADLQRGLQPGGLLELYLERDGEAYAVWVRLHSARGDWH